MKHTIGLYMIPRSEEWEKQQIKSFWKHLQLSRCDMAKLRRYQNKLCEIHSRGEYDHLKALDLIFYCVEGQRKKMPELIRPTIYICWQLTRYIVRDLEINTFKTKRAELEHFWEQETDQANAVFENWWKLNKRGLTKYAHGGII